MQETPDNHEAPATSSDDPTLPQDAISPEQAVPAAEPSSQPPPRDSTGPRVSRVVVWSSVIGALVIVGIIAALLLRSALGGGATQSANTQGQNTATTGATQPAGDTIGTATTSGASASPTSPAAPTATGAPTPPTFLVSDKNVTEACSAGLWPTSITVGNTGATPLHWSATAPHGVTLTPSNGTLPGGSQNSPTLQQVQLSGTYTQSELTIAFTSAGGNESVKVTCI